MMTRRQLILVTVSGMVGMFLAAMDVTIVGTAMPTIVATLGGMPLYSWVFSAYMLTSTTTVPIFGKLADLYGRRSTYLVSIGAFLLGSMLCGLARNMTELVVYRALQGIGGGGLIPITLTIIGDLYPLEKRARVQGLFSGMWGLASIVGPLIGGFLVDNLSWRWLFYINIPVGLLATALIYFFFEERHTPRPHAVDYPGLLTLTGSVTTLLLVTLVGGRNYPWLSWPVMSLLAGSAALLYLFVRIEKKAREPLLSLDLLRNKVIASCSLSAGLTGMGMFGAISFVPLFIQGVLGTSATRAGLALTPQTLAWTTASIISSHLVLRRGYRFTITTGLLLVSAAGYNLARMGQETPYWGAVANMLVLGAGLGLCMTAFIIAVQSAVTREQRGMATSSNLFFRSMGGTIGVTVMGAAMTARLGSLLQAGLPGEGLQGLPPEMAAYLSDPQAILLPAVRASMPAALLEAMQVLLSDAVRVVFWIALGVTLLALVSTVFLPGGKASDHAVRDPVPATSE